MPVGVVLLTVFSAYFSNERTPKMGMPFSFNVACSGVTFMYIGHLIRVLLDKAPKVIENKIKISGAIIILMLMGTLFFELNGGCNHLTAMSLLIALLIDNPLFAKYGKLTLPIYAFHLLVVGAVNMVYTHGIALYLGSYNLKAIVVGSVSLIATCSIIPIIRAIDSNLIGEHK